MQTEVGAYLPPMGNCTMYYIKDLINKKKRYKQPVSIISLFFIDIKSENVKVIHVPQYKGLNVERILEWCYGHETIASYFPDPVDIPLLNRQFILDVVYTIVGKPFSDFIRERIETRNAKQAEKMNAFVDVDEEIADMINASTHIAHK